MQKVENFRNWWIKAKDVVVAFAYISPARPTYYGLYKVTFGLPRNTEYLYGIVYGSNLISRKFPDTEFRTCYAEINQ